MDTNFTIILGLLISNALVALSGALVAQNNGFADVGMGTGTIVIGLASVIIGEVLFGTRSFKNLHHQRCAGLYRLSSGYCRCTADGNAAKRSETVYSYSGSVCVVAAAY